MTNVLFAVGWAAVGAAAGWLSRWGSVKLARLEELEPGFKPWQVYGPSVLAALLFGLFAYDLGTAHLLLLVLRSVFVLVFVQVIFFDLEHRLILDRVIFPAMALAAVASLWNQPWWAGIATGLAAGLIFLFLSVAGSAMLKAEVLGFGDVKLAAFMGLVLGWPWIVTALFYGVVLGAVAAVGVGIWKRSMHATFAYGPYLALGAIAVLYAFH
ncbi:MAG TPA: A24 family peptidase [Candidatus Dormibacteraeota bacterium]|nr:A24 family peptidase [Candidatus Dormibacteraeota bacterium]